jgi:hypothetical protein
MMIITWIGLIGEGEVGYRNPSWADYLYIVYR